MLACCHSDMLPCWQARVLAFFVCTVMSAFSHVVTLQWCFHNDVLCLLVGECCHVDMLTWCHAGMPHMMLPTGQVNILSGCQADTGHANNADTLSLSCLRVCGHRHNTCG